MRPVVEVLRRSPLGRCAVVFAAATLIGLFVMRGGTAVFGTEYTLARHVAVALAMSVLIIAVTLPARLYLDRLPLDAAGRHGRWRQLLLGMACWLLPATVGITACLAFGLATITLRRPVAETVLFALALLVLVFLYEALPEELVFRGYLFRNLGAVLPTWATVVGQAVLFTLWAFLLGAAGSGGRALLLFSFGLLLGAIRAVTGNIRVGVGFHAAFQTVAQLLSPVHPYFEIDGLERLQLVAFGLLPFALAIPLLRLIRLGGRSAREWLVDLGCAVAAVLVGALFVFGELITDPGAPVDLRWELVFGGFGCLFLLLFRRHWPVWVAVGLLPIAGVSAVGIGAAAVALFTVAAYRSRRITAALAGLYAVGLTGVYLLALPPKDFWATVVYVLFLLAIFVVSGLLVRSQRQLASRAELNQHLRIEEARRLERERIAREMHDVLAHRISLLTLHAGALEYAPRADPELARTAGVIRECAYAAAEDLREVVGVLRAPGSDAPQPVLTDLPDLVEQTRQTGTPVTFDNRLAGLDAVPASLGRHVFRVVQEGLTNARKHAPGRAVTVSLAGDRGNGLTVELRNPAGDAVSADSPDGGAGLIGLRERVELADGRISHGRTAEGDFRLQVWLPWPP